MKKFTTFRTLLVALMALGATSTWADETQLDPTGVFTWTNTPEIVYDAEATSWAINQGGISGGKIGRYAGPYAIVKFDASAVLEGKTLLSATLKFDITAGSNNSSINIAQMSDATFNPATVTTGTFDATASQFQAGDWSVKNNTKSFSYSVTDRVETSKVIAFAIYTNTGREQTLKNVKLSLEYSTGEVSKFNYSLKAVDEDNADITELVSGEEYEGKTVNAYFPYMFYNNDVLYTTTVTPYVVTLDKDSKTATVTYVNASSNIVAYVEGESFNVNTKDNSNYSNGKTGYGSANKTETIKTLPAGKYKATIMLESNGNRSIIIRDKENTDVTTNIIVALPIDKNSTAGIYESDEFVLVKETTIGFSGYTVETTKTNQSANIDYLYITKTGEAPTSVSATITDAGWATFYTDYALDFSGVTGLTAYTATLSESTVTLTEVTSVPAGTGVVLQGEAKTYEIPFIESSDTDKGDLKGSTTTAKEADGNQYVLIMNSESNAQFTKATSGSIAAGKAYLEKAESESRILNVVFAGEATGIKAIETAQADGNIYNMAGQRVAAPQKGLFIMNGKKVIIK